MRREECKKNGRYKDRKIMSTVNIGDDMKNKANIEDDVKNKYTKSKKVGGEIMWKIGIFVNTINVVDE